MARMSVSNAGRSATKVVGVAVLAVAAGCTMCPDPHDYSGPVPNGSAPQNDFRARSNGILPLGAAPVPWPSVVQATGETVDPEPSEAEGDALADTGDVATPGAGGLKAGLKDVAEERSAEVEEGVEPAGVEESFPDILPPPRPVRPERLPSLRETLGWKPRD